VNKKGVVELQLRVESVYLGDKRDETHIAEIEIVPLLGLSDTLDKATTVKPKAEASARVDVYKSAGLDKASSQESIIYGRWQLRKAR
jgi:hypothetical protein